MNPSDHIKIVDWHKEIPIILFSEVEKPTVESVAKNWEYVESLIDGKQFHMISDISKAPPPNAKVRIAVKEAFEEMEPYLASTQIYVGNNFLLKIALRFIAASLGIKKFYLTKTIEAAVERIKKEY